MNNFINGAASLEARRNYSYYKYNNTESNNIGAFRVLPDTRQSTCTARSYIFPARRQRVSVIIVFHNEGRSALLRTIMSVYWRTPLRFLYEFILIDDCSEDGNMFTRGLLKILLKTLFHLVNLVNSLQELDVPVFRQRKHATATQVKVQIERNVQRLGLIESRNRAAKLSGGDYLIFLDSHCEVNVGWLEPLLQVISTAAHSLTAVSPMLDIIDAQTLQYQASSNNLVGGFDWNLHFHWQPRQPTHYYSTDSYK